MAAKNGKTTKQYRQARKAAKPAAKAAFPGKVKAYRKDPLAKITAEDRIALQEMRDTAKADLGKNAYLSKAEYDAQQKAAREAFREKMRMEFGEYGGKKATPAEADMANTKAGGRVGPKKTTEAKPSVKKKTVKKAAAVKKPATPAPAKPATAPSTPAKPAAKKAAADRLAKAKAGAEKALKTAPKNVTSDTRVTNRPTDASLTAKEDAYLKQTKERLAKKAAAAPKPAAKPAAAAQAEAPKPKPTVKKPVAKAAAKPGILKKVGKFAGKAIKYGAIGSEVGSIIKGSTEKDWKEIQRLENKLAATKGQGPRYKNMGSNKNPVQAMTADASHMANLLTLGLVGKTRRQRMDQLNRQIKKAESAAEKKALATKPAAKPTPKYVSTSASGKKTLSPNHMSSTPNLKVNIGAGGSTTSTGSKYTVKKGDTFSAIAKNAGVSLSELRTANPDIMKKPKYKKGSMIWSGTKVNIPKKK